METYYQATIIKQINSNTSASGYLVKFSKDGFLREGFISEHNLSHKYKFGKGKHLQIGKIVNVAILREKYGKYFDLCIV